MMKRQRWLALLLCVALLLTGCAAQAGNTEMMGDGMYVSREEVSNEYGVYVKGSGEAAALPENRKLIRTIRVSAESTDLDALLDRLGEQIGALGGYVEHRNIYHGSSRYGSSQRSAELTIRIPVDSADAFLVQVETHSNVISSDEDLEDVTLSYVATESRMKALQTEEARLLELIGKASTVSELLEIEARLTDIRYELENVTSQLRVYDNQIDYATIHLSVSEVEDLTVVEPESVWQRMGRGFMETVSWLQNFFVELSVALVAGSPVLVLLGIVALGVVLIVRRGKKKQSQQTQDDSAAS